MARIELEKGIVFNGEHSYDDYKMMLTGRNIGLPNKNKTLKTVPYSNVEYDFSLLFGDQTYGQRELSYVFTLFNHHDIPNLEAWRIMCINWLMGVNEQSKLTDDEIEDYYFLGEAREAPECAFDYETDSYEIRVTFTCYPFKISEYAEGDDDWDSFNFDTDVFQDTVFEVIESETVTIQLYNTGQTVIVPTVKAAMAAQPETVGAIEWAERAALKITKDSTTFSLSGGENNISQLKLERGLNTMTLTGIGTVEFIWYKELL